MALKPGESCTLKVRVQPKAFRNQVDGYEDGTLRLRVTAPPSEGQANTGVIALLAKALGPEIRVNAVAPGTIQFEGEKPDENYIRRAPLKKTGTGDDIAQTVLFLCAGSEFITGQVLVVDGGYSLA